MAKRKSSRRGRSRKPSASRRRAPSTAPAGPDPGAATAATAGQAARRPSPRQPARAERRARANEPARGTRPQAPWHPLPLSELLIFVGLIGVLVWYLRGAGGGAALIGASVVAVAIGTIEVVLREHLAGFRSHTVLLAAIPVVVFHSAAIIVASAFTAVPRWINIPLLAIDLALFALLYKLLRLRYLDARRERRFAGRG